MSDKILYNEVKAEQKFSTLMNAALSHELRNPLNSLIGGIDTMKNYLQNILVVIEKLDENQLTDSDQIILDKLKLISKGLHTNQRKMGNQTGLIDYFVHNMLDYSILLNNDESFTKEKNNFDIYLCMK